MKKTFLFIFALCLCANVFAQDISVVSFLSLEADHTANTEGTAVLDTNGDKCALIKISTSQTGFTFNVDPMSVVKVVERDKEIWLYVPAGVKHLTISHSGMEPLRNYDLGMELQKASTYLMILKTAEDVALRTVTFKVASQDVAVTIESVDPQSSFKKRNLTFVDGETTIKIPDGNYKYTAALPSQKVIESTLAISSSTRNVDLSLSTADTPQPIVDSSVLTFTVKGVTFSMIAVEGGTFVMGSDTGSIEEKPAHKVTLSSFYVGETEVTQMLWKAIMGKNPSFWKGEKRPVNYVTWENCREFISALNSLTGKQFRFLTEAEWEYAARGGNKSQGYTYSGGNDIRTLAWYGSSDGCHPVKSKIPNELGLYDMTGNVYEWCSDWYDVYQSGAVTDPTGPANGSAHVYRGGCYNIGESFCTVTSRRCDMPSVRFNYIGLRLALSM